MFRAATEWALEERLPVVYLAANSGARVGLANEVKQCLRVSSSLVHAACSFWLVWSVAGYLVGSSGGQGRVGLANKVFTCEPSK